MRRRAHRGRGPSRWNRALEAVATATAGLAALIAMADALRVTDTPSDGATLAIGGSVVAALAWTVGRRAERAAARIESIAATRRRSEKRGTSNTRA